jgi:hypothetical protein
LGGSWRMARPNWETRQEFADSPSPKSRAIHPV